MKSLLIEPPHNLMIPQHTKLKVLLHINKVQHFESYLSYVPYVQLDVVG